MKTTLRKCLCLVALASSGLLMGASDASACHRGWYRSRCYSSCYYQTYSYPTCYSYQTCYTYPTTYSYQPYYYSYPTTYTYATAPTYAPVPVYAAPQAPTTGTAIPAPPAPTAAPAR
jgi:hypothetical protein